MCVSEMSVPVTLAPQPEVDNHAAFNDRTCTMHEACRKELCVQHTWPLTAHDHVQMVATCHKAPV